MTHLVGVSPEGIMFSRRLCSFQQLLCKSWKSPEIGITFRHVPFDVAELARLIRASGRPYAEEAIFLYRREQ
jgi:hypothetical protein